MSRSPGPSVIGEALFLASLASSLLGMLRGGLKVRRASIALMAAGMVVMGASMALLSAMVASWPQLTVSS